MSQMLLFQKSKKGEGEAKTEIPVCRTMVPPEKDLSPKEE